MRDWIAFVDTVDEATNLLLMAVVPFSGEPHGLLDLSSYVAKISRSQPKEAHEIWQSLLQYSYPEEALVEALSNIANWDPPHGLAMAKSVVTECLRVRNDKPNQILRSVSPRG